MTWAYLGGGGQGVRAPEKSQKIGNNGTDPLKNHKATTPAFNTPAFNFGPLSASQRSAIQMAFRWRVDHVPLIMVFVWTLSPVLKKNFSKLDPL